MDYPPGGFTEFLNVGEGTPNWVLNLGKHFTVFKNGLGNVIKKYSLQKWKLKDTWHSRAIGCQTMQLTDAVWLRDIVQLTDTVWLTDAVWLTDLSDQQNYMVERKWFLLLFT